jgi:hypothetical protein
MVLGLPTGEVQLFNAHEAWADGFECERVRIVDAIGDLHS